MMGAAARSDLSGRTPTKRPIVMWSPTFSSSRPDLGDDLCGHGPDRRRCPTWIELDGGLREELGRQLLRDRNSTRGFDRTSKGRTQQRAEGELRGFRADRGRHELRCRRNPLEAHRVAVEE